VSACIHELWEQQVEKTPEAVALRYGDRHLTYGELNRRANRLAHHLQSLGVGPEVFVGVCLEPSEDAVIALIGILKAGGAYVYLDPDFPRKRVEEFLQDSQPRLIVTNADFQGRFPGEFVWVDICAAELSEGSTTNPAPSATADSAAYILYTSGSTGKPKGTVEVHRSLTARLKSGQLPDFQPGDVCCLNSSFGSGITASRLFIPLVSGLPVVVLCDADVKDVSRFVRALDKYGVTSVFLSPDLLRAVLTFDSGMLSHLANIRAVTVTGAALTPELVESFFRALPRAQLVNVYGSTEIGTTATLKVMTQGSDSRQISLGRPVAYTRIYLLDENLIPVPSGAPGEMYVGAEHMARGYLNRPDLTREKFVPNPFVPGERLYRTGDLGRTLPNGEIQFLGRRDHQVKIRGFRIELGEIEAVLEEYAGVREAAVTAQDFGADKRLIAYVVPKTDASLAATDLRQFLRDRLPDHMVPSAFVPLALMPRTSSGKVDRNALPQYDSGWPEVGNPSEPSGAGNSEPRNASTPHGAIEILLTRIWEDVLGRRPIRADENFFDLGGHSLIALRLLTEISRQFDVDLGFEAILEAGTIGALARLIESNRKNGDAPRSAAFHSLVPIQPGGTKPPLFCIHGVGGVVLNYHGLAQGLGADQPVYGLQSRGLSGQVPGTVEEMASHYIQEIRRLQPEGPYFVCGQSFGGLLAYEIGRQLEAQGRTVGLVALIDTLPTGLPRGTNRVSSLLATLRSYAGRFVFHCRMVLLGPARLHYLESRARTRRRKFRAFLYRWTYRRFARKAQDLPAILQDIELANYKAARNHVPGIYHGRAVLFRCKIRSAGDHPEYAMGWDRLALGGLQVFEVPGDHVSMMSDPSVATLARQLAICLETDR
jgi:amino acid adenylation domain-containing protein